MKKYISYLGAVLAVSGGLFLSSPSVAFAAEATQNVAAQSAESQNIKNESIENWSEENGIAVDSDENEKIDVTEKVVIEEDIEVKESALKDIDNRDETSTDIQDSDIADSDSAQENEEIRQALVEYALQFVGRPYRNGGNDPHTGADCSGFVRYVMQNCAGISMNRTSRDQAQQGTVISSCQMQPGDLLFYGNGSRINHVAMYIGDGKIVHASTERSGIKTSKWNYRMPIRIVSMLG